MKESQFNNFFPYEGKRIGYNAYSNEFAILEPELYDLYIAARNEKDWPELQKIHPEFYDFLIEKGFLVTNETDEIQKVKDLVQKVDHGNEEFFQLTINPTMNCNFKCWYCYETHIKASKMTKSTMLSVTKLVEGILEDKSKLKAFHLQWFGGEPLLYFDSTVQPLLESIYPKMLARNISFSSAFTTNGFLINQKMLDTCKRLGVNFFQITLDGHRERHNQVRYVSKERGSYDEIVANIKLTLKNEIRVGVRLNVSQETLDSNLLEVLNDFSDITEKDKTFLNFSFHEVWQEEKDIAHDIQEVVNKYREQNMNTLYKGANLDTVRNSCYADKTNFVTINYNGELFKCTARDFESKSREGVLTDDGKIEWNDKHEKRMNSKFKNPPCLTCSILPICNGGCSQQAIENEGREYCVNNFDEQKKIHIIKDKFLYAIS